MMMDRKTLKMQSQVLLTQSLPAPWLVTLVYIAATAWLSTAAEQLNPIARQIAAISDSLQNSYLQMDESAMVSAVYSMQQLAQKPAFFVTVLVSVLLTLYALVVEFGYQSYSLSVIRQEETGVGELFSRFYMTGKIILAQLLSALFIGLWAMLFIIPGIVAAYRYRMIPYILLDDPDCSVLEAFRRSKEMMDGRKMEFFTLEMSFLPWIMGASALVYLAASFAGNGIPGTVAGMAVSAGCNMFLFPYQHFTFAQWYEALRLGKVAGQEQVIDADDLE